jgi:membrane-associated HD superfamily phosphohydrolase
MRGKEMPFRLKFLKPDQSLSGKYKKRMSTAILFAGLIFVLVTSYLLYIPQQEIITEHSLKVGDIVKEDIKIEKDITVEDTASTTAKRKQAIDNVVPVYEYYEENQAGSADLINRWFQLITDARKDYIKNQKNKKQLNKIKDQIGIEFGLDFDEREIQLLLKSNFFSQMDLNPLLAFVNSLYDKKILRSLIGAKQSKTGTIKVVSKTGEPIILDINKIYDLNKTKTALIQFIKEQGFSNDPVEFIASTLMNFIQENIAYSLNLTQE